MTISATCLLAICHAAASNTGITADDRTAPQIAYAQVLDTGAADSAEHPSDLQRLNRTFVSRALQPVGEGNAFDDAAFRIGRQRAFKGGKLLLTNGVTTVEGSSGGGIARWATIGGLQMPGGIGISGHFTAIELPDFGWRSYGAAVGVGDRIELSFAHVDFNTRAAGELLGLGEGYTLNQDVFGAKIRVAGDLVYGPAWMPQIAVGIEHKRNQDGAVVRALGAADDTGTDFTVSATKLLLGQSLLLNASLRYTKANQIGLLGFGSAGGEGYRLQFEGSLGYQLSRRAMVGAEFRSKPDDLGLGEDDWMDVFAAYALTDSITFTAAYVDLGSIATFADQRGGFLSAQVAF
jgi:hypothetical protein